MRTALRQSLALLFTMAGLLLLDGGVHQAVTQHRSSSVPPVRGTESPIMIMSAFLSHRHEITRRSAIVVVCGTSGLTLTTAIRADTIRAKALRSESIEARPTCASAQETRQELKQWRGAADFLYVTRMVFGQDTSIVEAMVAPMKDGQRPFAFIRRERLTWDHSRDIGGISLTFSEFSGPHD